MRRSDIKFQVKDVLDEGRLALKYMSTSGAVQAAVAGGEPYSANCCACIS
jgi:hypothetical protein